MRVPIQTPGTGRGFVMRRRLRLEALLPSCAACDADADSYDDDNDAEEPMDADDSGDEAVDDEGDADDGGDEE